ncbi:MAG: leucine-rich repeat protein [Oscillospiraceae bacterium]|nr:leucine-rich repeat protein [Oscillospiraceae bacterium]
MMKRILALFLCLVLLVSALPLTGAAEEGKITPVATRLKATGEDGNSYVYCVYPAEEGYGADYFAAVEYVEWDTEHDITSLTIPAYVPYDDAQVPMRYISIPENSTFRYGCLSDLSGPLHDTLREVEIPETAEGIGRQAFWKCTQLTTVTLHEGLKSIDYGAFFGDTALTALALPSTLETLGEACFKGCTALASVDFSRVTALRTISKEAFYSAGVTDVALPEGLTTVGAEAFRNSAVRWLSFPSTLQTLEPSCFEDCKSLQTVLFAEHTDPAFRTINGFASCAALTEIQIPDTVRTIGNGAFYQCGLTSVIIPASVELIENKAFGFNANLASLIILPGTTPLTIGPLAFQYCTALGTSTVTLPKRVTELQEGCFSNIPTAASPSYLIYNDRLRLVDNEAYTQQNWEGGLPVVTGAGGENAPDPWFHCIGDPTIRYPETMTEATSPSFLQYKTFCEENADGRVHPVFETFDATQPQTYTVSGAVPEGAAVAVASGGALVPVTMTGRQFAAQAAADLPVTVSVTLDGYAERTFTKDGADFHADWDIGNLTLDGFTPTSLSGDLAITVTGAADANLAVLDAEGKLAAAGKAEGSFFLAADLPAGKYTVLGFGDNPYVSAISAESDLLALGIKDYGKAENVAVSCGEQTALELNVPVLSLGSGALEKGGVLLAQQQLAPGVDFTVRVNYKMAAEHPAEQLTFNVPDGLTIVSVASQNKNYGKAAVVEPDGADRWESVISLTLRAEKTGAYAVSAAVTSGGIVVPLGSASCRVKDLVLELPETFVHNRDVPVTVYAAPNTTVTLQAGIGAPVKVTTNLNGAYRGLISLPKETVGGTRTAIIASTDDAAVHQSAVMAPMEAQIEESYFIHAGVQTYGHKDGVNVSGGYYTYVANGDEKNKYWTYSVVFEGSLLTDQVILNVYMMDGSVRHEAMTLASVENGATGYRQTYVCTLYLEQGGDHVFFPNLVPTGYDVTFTYMGRAFTMDADAVIYIRQLAAIDDGGWRQGVDDILGEYGLEPGDADGIFDHGSIADAPDFAELPPEVQDAALQYEQAIADALDAMLDLLGCEKDWDDYDDADDFLEDMGVDYDADVPYDPDALADDGFTVTPPDSDGNSFAFRDTPTDDGGSRHEYRDSSGTSLTVDAHANAISNASLTASGYALDALNEAADNFSLKKLGVGKDWLDAHPNIEKGFNKLSGVGKVGGALLGGALEFYQVANDAGDYVSAVEEYEKLKGDLENARIYQNYYKTHNYSDVCQWAIRDEIAAGERLLELLRKQKNHALLDAVVGAGFTAAGIIAALPSAGSSLAAVETLNAIYDVLSNAINLNRSSQIVMKLADYVNAMNQRYQRCGSLKTKGDCSFATRMDPSGIVFEAVESNLLSGVTATCFDVTNNTVWDGAPFGETNPQITGDEGFYAWDVPVGDWRVDFIKEGYEKASTPVVTVPPPQMGLKTGMVAKDGPEIAAVHAYPDCVEFIFTQYMSTVAQLSIPSGYTAEWVDPEPIYEGCKTCFATVLHLIPEKPAELGGKVDIKLDGAKNYADKPLAAYAGTLAVEPRPATMVLNYEEQIALFLNEAPAPRVTAQILDADGKPIKGLTVNASGCSELLAEVMAIRAVTDENGVAVFEIRALLPGMTELRLSVDGTALTKTLPLKIEVESNQVARPTATVGETVIGAGAPKDNYLTVEEGTVLTLSCETEGAVIYYTLNDTCPCQDTANRVAYTAPVTLTESGYYRISAYKPGMEYSERLNLHITVNAKPVERTNPFTDVHETDFFYDAVLWAANAEPQVTAGTSATTFSPNATCTRAQVVTFLWRAKGCPEPKSGSNPFTDVASGEYYYKAVLWAVENEVTAGTSATTFSPNAGCTRAQVVTFLWRAEGKPAPGSSDNLFTDVASGEYYYTAVLWAVEKDITKGTSATTFSPNATCTRGQIVTFLYRADKK